MLSSIESENYTDVYISRLIDSKISEKTYTIKEKLAANGALAGQFCIILF